MNAPDDTGPDGGAGAEPPREAPAHPDAPGQPELEPEAAPRAEPAGHGSGTGGGGTGHAQEAAAAEEIEDLLQPGDSRPWVVGSVRAQASFMGTTHIGSVVIGDARQNIPVPLTDLIALHAASAFVPPPGYDALRSALREQRVVLCHGPDGCGKELAVTRALAEAGEKVVRLLPVGLEPSHVRQVLEAAADGGGCYVLPGLDDTALRALSGIAGQSIRALAGSGRVKVIVVTAATPGAAAQRNFAVAALGYPEAARVLDAYCTDRGVGRDVRELAADALGRLTAPLGPVVITAVLDQAQADPAQDPEALADSFSGALTANAVQSWVTAGPRPQDIAMLAAGASLPGTASVVAQEQAVKLRDFLLADQPDNDAPPQPGPLAAWPAGLLCTRTQLRNTHFGLQPVSVVDVAAPHLPHELIQSVWRSLDGGFHSAFCDWLSALAEVRGLHWQAAYTAGVLFAIDPVVIEGRVLRPWLHSQDPAVQRWAGLALGAPVAIGADSSGARKLAHHWATNDSLPLRRAAVAAYGGLLGAWDTASAAPLKLFLIGEFSDRLRSEADLAMASLVVSGAEAVAARSTVIAYLQIAARTRSTRARAYGCLPSLVRLLNWPSTVCAESFAALRAEGDNWKAFAGLLAAALVSPDGLDAGHRCLALFVAATADGNADHEVVEDVIRDMRSAQRDLGNAPRLGRAVRRSLVLLSRSDSAGVRDVATGLLNKFFG